MFIYTSVENRTASNFDPIHEHSTRKVPLPMLFSIFRTTASGPVFWCRGPPLSVFLSERCCCRKIMGGPVYPPFLFEQAWPRASQVPCRRGSASQRAIPTPKKPKHRSIFDISTPDVQLGLTRTRTRRRAPHAHMPRTAPTLNSGSCHPAT